MNSEYKDKVAIFSMQLLLCLYHHILSMCFFYIHINSLTQFRLDQKANSISLMD